jgi:hypothetical protein
MIIPPCQHSNARPVVPNTLSQATGLKHRGFALNNAMDGIHPKPEFMTDRTRLAILGEKEFRPLIRGFRRHLEESGSNNTRSTNARIAEMFLKEFHGLTLKALVPNTANFAISPAEINSYPNTNPEKTPTFMLEDQKHTEVGDG